MMLKHIHEDVELFAKDLSTLAERAALDPVVLPGLTDLKDHPSDLDAHTHDVRSYVMHVETEINSGGSGM